jgi:hypothetical protein
MTCIENLHEKRNKVNDLFQWGASIYKLHRCRFYNFLLEMFLFFSVLLFYMDVIHLLANVYI